MTDRERVWALGPALLGDTPANRKLLGQLLGQHGETAVAEVLAEATLDPPIEPKSWLIAACTARGKSAPKANGNHAPQSTLDLLNRDPRPDWVVKAGFEDIFAAETSGCGPGNFRKFRDGQRVEQ